MILECVGWGTLGRELGMQGSNQHTQKEEQRAGRIWGMGTLPQEVIKWD